MDGVLIVNRKVLLGIAATTAVHKLGTDAIISVETIAESATARHTSTRVCRLPTFVIISRANVRPSGHTHHFIVFNTWIILFRPCCFLP